MQKARLLYTVILSMLRVDPASSTNLAFRVTLSVKHVLNRQLLTQESYQSGSWEAKARRGKEETMCLLYFYASLRSLNSNSFLLEMVLDTYSFNIRKF